MTHPVRASRSLAGASSVSREDVSSFGHHVGAREPNVGYSELMLRDDPYNEDILSLGDLVLLGSDFGIICYRKPINDERSCSTHSYGVLWSEGSNFSRSKHFDERFNTWNAITVASGVLKLLSPPFTHPEINL